MWNIVLSLLQITALLFVILPQNNALVTNVPINSTPNPAQTPQYRFHYYVKDEKTGDYKAQEERRTGDSVSGTYVVGEPNGDLRVVNYVADVSNGFKADVSVQPGASPVKGAVTNLPPKDGIAAFNNYRTGISAPPRMRNKPARGFSPIVVKRLSPLTPSGPPPAMTELPAPGIAAAHPYPFFKDAAANVSSSSPSLVYTTTQMPKKSAHGDATYNADAVLEKIGETSALHEDSTSASVPLPPPSPASANGGDESHQLADSVARASAAAQVSQSGLHQLANMAIPSSIMQIMNQHKAKAEATFVAHVGDTTTASSTAIIYADPETASLRIDSAATSNGLHLPGTQQDVGGGGPFSTEATAAVATATAAKKIPLPQRPMRLIGLSPIYMEISQLQTITVDNLTSVPQLQLEPFTNMQYATPAPFHSGPLPNGPAGPFRNLPRAVSETNGELPIINTIPVVNSIPISAPIISQAFSTDIKGDTVKGENKTPPPTAASLPLCTDCLFPSNYGPYTMLKMPVPVSMTSNQKPPCPPAPNNTPYWSPYAPSLAYILMPTPILKNKFNETRF